MRPRASTMNANDVKNQNQLDEYVSQMLDDDEKIVKSRSLDRAQKITNFPAVTQEEIYMLLTVPTSQYLKITHLIKIHNEAEYENFNDSAQKHAVETNNLSLLKTEDEKYQEKRESIQFDLDALSEQMKKILKDTIEKAFNSLTVQSVYDCADPNTVQLVDTFFKSSISDNDFDLNTESNVQTTNTGIENNVQNVAQTTTNGANMGFPDMGTMNNLMANMNSQVQNMNEMFQTMKLQQQRFAEQSKKWEQEKVLFQQEIQNLKQQSVQINQSSNLTELHHQKPQISVFTPNNIALPKFCYKNNVLNEAGINAFFLSHWNPYLFSVRRSLDECYHIIPEIFEKEVHRNQARTALHEYTKTLNNRKITENDYPTMAKTIASMLTGTNISEDSKDNCGSNLLKFKIQKNLPINAQLNYLKKNLLIFKEPGENSEAQIVAEMRNIFKKAVLKAYGRFTNQTMRILFLYNEVNDLKFDNLKTYLDLATWAIKIDEKDRPEGNNQHQNFKNEGQNNDDDMEVSQVSHNNINIKKSQNARKFDYSKSDRHRSCPNSNCKFHPLKTAKFCQNCGHKFVTGDTAKVSNFPSTDFQKVLPPVLSDPQITPENQQPSSSPTKLPQNLSFPQKSQPEKQSIKHALQKLLLDIREEKQEVTEEVDEVVDSKTTDKEEKLEKDVNMIDIGNQVWEDETDKEYVLPDNLINLVQPTPIQKLSYDKNLCWPNISIDESADPDKILNDSGATLNYLTVPTFTKWSKITPLQIHQDKLVHKTYTQNQVKVKGYTIVPRILISDHYGNSITVKNIPFRIVENAKNNIVGQQLRSIIERDHNRCLISIASRGLAKLVELDKILEDQESEELIINQIYSSSDAPESLVPPILEVDEDKVIEITDKSQSKFDTLHIQDNIDINIGTNRSSDFKNQLKLIIQENIEVVDGKFSIMNTEPALIRFRDGTMTYAKKYQNVAENLKRIMKIKIGEMVEKKMMKVSDRLPVANLFLVDKENNLPMEDPNRWRLVANFKTLNAESIIPMGYNLPNTAHIFENCTDGVLFAKFDIKDAFSSCPITCSGDNKIVVTAAGLTNNYEFLTLPQGLAVSSQLYSGKLDQIFYDCQEWMVKFIDDVLIFAQSEEQLLERLKTLFEISKKHNIHFNMKKMIIGVESCEFLGRRIMNGKITISDSHRAAIKNLDGEKLKRESLVGLIRYFQPHLCMKAPNCLPVLEAQGNWTEAKEKALMEIKTALVNSNWNPIYTKDKLLVISTDSSLNSMGACIFISKHKAADIDKIKVKDLECMEMLDMKTRVMANIPSWKNATIYMKELYALSFACEKFKYYIESSPAVLILIDNKAVYDSAKSSVFKIKNFFEALSQNHPHVKIALIRSATNVISDILSRPTVTDMIPSDGNTEFKYQSFTYNLGGALKKANTFLKTKENQISQIVCKSDYQSILDKNIISLKEESQIDSETNKIHEILINQIDQDSQTYQQPTINATRAKKKQFIEEAGIDENMLDNDPLEMTQESDNLDIDVSGDEEKSERPIEIPTETKITESEDKIIDLDQDQENDLTPEQERVKKAFFETSTSEILKNKTLKQALMDISDGFYNNLTEKQKHKMWVRIAHKNTGCQGPKANFQMYKDFVGDQKMLLGLQDIRDIIGTCTCYKAKTSPTAMLTIPKDCNSKAYMDYKSVIFEYKGTKYKKSYISFSERLSGIRLCLPALKATAADALLLLAFVLQVMGHIKVLVTDNAQVFKSREFNDFLDLMGIEHQYSLIQNPQSNYSEILHKSINRLIRNNPLISSQALLPKICKNIMARNSTKNHITKSSAYEIMFGHQKPFEKSIDHTQTGDSALNVQKLAFDKLSKEKLSKIPKSIGRKKFEVGDRVIASYPVGNRSIDFKGTVSRVLPNYIMIKKKNGMERRWAYKYVKHRENLNKVIDVGAKLD